MSVAAEPKKKGYWICQVVAIHDQATFGKYVAESTPLFSPGNKYGAKFLVAGPVTKQFTGSPVIFGGIVEFDSLQMAIDFFNDPAYVSARANMGDDESKVVERRNLVIEGDELPPLKPGQGIWLAHVEAIGNMEKFGVYAGAPKPQIKASAVGPVHTQLNGKDKMIFAGAMVFDSKKEAEEMYTSPDYVAARAAAGMEPSEDAVVKRIIGVIEVPPAE